MLLLIVKRQQLKRLENCAHRDDGWLTVKSQLITIVAALLVVGCGPSVDIHQAAHDGDIQAVKQYLNASGDVNAKGEDGRTPLHVAVIGRQKKIVKLLLAEGADVNAKNRVELTPLYHAAIYGHTEVAEFLIAKGANVNAKDKNGSTPLHLATAGDRKGIVELFIAKSADVNAKNKGGRTPLDSAIAFKHTETADLLRKHGGKTGEELKAEGK